jgi:hypothetical protein
MHCRVSFDGGVLWQPYFTVGVVMTREREGAIRVYKAGGMAGFKATPHR